MKVFMAGDLGFSHGRYINVLIIWDFFSVNHSVLMERLKLIPKHLYIVLNQTPLDQLGPGVASAFEMYVTLKYISNAMVII